MKYFYEFLVLIIVVLAVLAFVFKNIFGAIFVIALFFIGCVVEYLLNWKKR